MEQLSMPVGVEGQHPQKHDPVCRHLDHLSNAAIGVIVTDEDELTFLEDETRSRIAHVRVGQPGGVDSVEVDPQVSLWCWRIVVGPGYDRPAFGRA